MNTHNDYLFRGDLVDLDPAVSELIELESERQAHKLIMIPSESSSPLAVRQALGSSLNNIYAEGYPNADSRWLTEPEILDYDHHLAHYRRYGDQRYYRGVEYADVIEALGVHIDVPPEAIARCIGEVGIGFLYAPLLHDAMRYVVHARREMRIRTVFNLLGPVCNPAGANAQIVGVYNEDLTDIMAQVLCELGTRRAFVVHGSDGLDEITVSGETKISEVRNGEVRTYYIAPEHFGIGRAPTSELLGGDARQNAEVVRGVLSGAQGPKTDVVLLNAAAGLVAGGMSETLQEGIALARESIRSGRALQCLNRLAALTGELAPRSG